MFWKRPVSFVLLILSLWAVVNECIAQQNFSVSTLDVRQGLLSNFVTRTVSDEKELKYFATEAGICRYDGYEFRHYKPQPGLDGLQSENIETLLPSANGYIWIGTKTGGLSRLNVRTQSIENWNKVFAALAKKPVRFVSLAEDKQGNLWAGTWASGVFKLNIASRKLTEHFPSTRPIYSMISDERGTVWFTDGSTVCRYKQGEGTLQRDNLPYTPYSLCADTARKRVWVVGNTAGSVRLSWYDQVQGTAQHTPIQVKARFAASLAIDRANRLWVGSWGNGLFISNADVTALNAVNTSPFGLPELNTNHKSITNIYIDKNDIAWLSTSYGGVLILYPNKGFKSIGNNNAGDLSDHNVSALLKTNNELFVGSISQGLYKIGNMQSARFQRVRTVPPFRINYLLQKGKHWLVGTNDGLLHFANGPESEPQRYFPLEKITAILLSRRNELWLGTQQHGLLKMPWNGKPDSNSVMRFDETFSAPKQIGSNRINRLIEDSADRIWIATHAGLNIWSNGQQRMLQHDEIAGTQMPAVIVHDIMVQDSTVFCATPNGLYRSVLRRSIGPAATLQLESHINERNGLVNEFICALQRDRNGNLWFSSTTGLARLNVHSNTLHHFGRQDGVQVNAFHIGSSYSDSLGNLYFGGDNGLIYFNPEDVIARKSQPGVVYTGITVNNLSIEIGRDSALARPLKEAVPYTQSISLQHTDNHFAVRFAANDFLGRENIVYAYQLKPANEDWVLLHGKNEVGFTSLSPGNYTLSVRANRNSEGWGPPVSMQVSIAYPPWLRWYAWLFYVVVAGFVVWLVRKERLRRQALKLQLQRVGLEKEKEHEINEAKINFFTNISHEFRTPLTLIMSPSTELLESESLPAAQRQKVTLIRNNAQKLLKLINQLLDFRKSEHGLLQLNTQRHDLGLMLHQLVTDFMPAAEKKKIQLQLIKTTGGLTAEVDRTQMEMAINNLLSNAIKFTPMGGTVTVEVTHDESDASICVSDTGIGIDASHLDKAFNRFYQVPGAPEAGMGSGIGLAFARNIAELHSGTLEGESRPGVGSRFTIRFPLRQKGLLPQDIKLEPEEEANAEIPVMAAKTLVHREASNRQLVLIVDDNDDIRSYLSQLLQSEYSIVEANNGASGLKAALEHLPDLIISDVMMPEMSGTALCTELKNNMATSHIPIMLLTARASEVNELSGLQTGADDYLVKPFHPQVVQARVKNTLETRKKLMAWYQRRVRFEPETDLLGAENLDEVFLQKAIDLVNENLQNDELGIEMMVDRLFMSQSTLFRKIKSLTGLSLTGFIRALRVKKAAQLIIHTNMKMNDIAMECGFNDYKYFKKTFQQQFECLPSEYKSKHSTTLQP